MRGDLGHARTLEVAAGQRMLVVLSCCPGADCAALPCAAPPPHPPCIPAPPPAAGVCVAFGADGSVVIDPDEAEEAAARSVVTVAYPACHTLVTPDGAAAAAASGGHLQQLQQQQQHKERQLVVPDETLLVASRGPLQVQQLASALATARQGCEGVSRFVHLGLTSSFREALLATQEPAAV